jgi:hypothetical protein
LKNYLLVGLLLAFSHHLIGQGKVEVVVDPAIVSMDEARTAKNKSMGIKIYRIMVAFYPTRTAATEKLNEVKSWFGNKYGATMIFDEPNFKIYVGEFSSKTDADAAYNEIKRKYSSATIVYDYKNVGK